jgi:hypothetical protein
MFFLMRAKNHRTHLLYCALAHIIPSLLSIVTTHPYKTIYQRLFESHNDALYTM